MEPKGDWGQARDYKAPEGCVRASTSTGSQTSHPQGGPCAHQNMPCQRILLTDMMVTKTGKYNPTVKMGAETWEAHFSLSLSLFYYYFGCCCCCWPHWVFVPPRGLSLVAESQRVGGYSSLRYCCSLLWWLLLLQRIVSSCVGFRSCSTQPQ